VFQPAAAPPKNKRARKSDPIDEETKTPETSDVSSDEEPRGGVLNSEVMRRLACIEETLEVKLKPLPGLLKLLEEYRKMPACTAVKDDDARLPKKGKFAIAKDVTVDVTGEVPREIARQGGMAFGEYIEHARNAERPCGLMVFPGGVAAQTMTCHIAHLPLDHVKEGQTITNYCLDKLAKQPFYDAQMPKWDAQNKIFLAAVEEHLALKGETMEGWPTNKKEQQAMVDPEVWKLHPSSLDIKKPTHPSSANKIGKAENFCGGCKLFFHPTCHVLWHTTLMYTSRAAKHHRCACKREVEKYEESLARRVRATATAPAAGEEQPAEEGPAEGEETKEGEKRAEV